MFCEEVSGPESTGDALDRAARAALTDRGVASLVVPRPLLTVTAPTGLGDAVPADFSPPVRVPDDGDVRRAAEVLDGAGKPAVLVGNAGRAAAGPAVGVASLLGAGVATTALARDALPDDLSYVAGVAGPLGSEAVAALLRECDTLLLVGAEDLAPALLSGAASCRIVTVDREPADCPLDRARPAVWVNSDMTAALEALLPPLSRVTDRTWHVRVEETVRSSRAAGHARANRYRDPFAVHVKRI
ncbi:hypothetical protein [Streptomyces sp. NPDC004546]|uniref:hypothetical protein n=1 Tax=unclassified Streptomyces TaxID=2593676 RepID=UPI0033A768DF